MEEYILFPKLNKKIDYNSLVENLHPLENDMIFIAGSLVEEKVNINSKGMGNIFSDIDIFILRNTDKDREFDISIEGYDYKSVKIDFKRINDINIDIEYYRQEDIYNLIQQLNKVDFLNCNRSRRLKTWIKLPNGIILDRFLSFLHRLYYSISIYNIYDLEILKKSINYKNYFKFSAQYYIQMMDMRYDDVLGNIKYGDQYVAVQEAREMLTYCMAAYIFSYEESIDRLKWVPLRLKNIAELDTTVYKIYLHYEKLLFNTILTNEQEIENYVEEVFNLLEYVVGIIRKKFSF
ncbi:hypothetical protein [Treponema pedis]|uniref:Polymerase nucleotidyl transferase domain-containing protein n=1 Tax=Treponema pedis TaxID=409322 RepID=A0A7S7AWP2_9SPIR|nr:hypothetical protein [Treponema pedis]QOW60934.1 hypothetical protein IFE08_00455 [Treponema pedis]